MNERLKMIRKSLGLNQTEFGEKVGLRQSTITGYENGSRKPKDAIIRTICNTYRVNEEWLRTGTGEMFIEMSHKEKTIKFMNDVALKNGLDPEDGFTARLIDLLSDMSFDEWEVIRKIAERWYRLEKEARDPDSTAADENGRD